MNIDFGRPFQYMFEDKDWMKKVLLLAVCPFIPVVGMFSLMGYRKRLISQIADGKEVPLPEPFDGFGENIVEGLKMFVIALVYLLPGLVVILGAFIVATILGAAMGRSGNDIGGILMIAGMCLGLPLTLVGALASPAGILLYIDEGRMGAAFSVGNVIGFLKANLINILLAIVVGMIAGFVANLGLILCLVGILVTAPYAGLVKAHAQGQVLKGHRAGAGAPRSVTGTPAYTR